MRREARAILKVARDVLALEFDTQAEADAYKKLHKIRPNTQITVKQPSKPSTSPSKPSTSPSKPTTTPAPKPVQKPVESKPDGFTVPSHKSLKYEMSGNLGNVEKWKAKIVLGNSMSDDKKVGDMDDVGYVAINTKSNEIIPIARGDEHQTGYELLHHLSDKGVIKGDPKDYITLFNGNNYPDYHHSGTDTDEGRKSYVAGVKMWLALGGQNGPMVGANGKKFTTDMEEYVALEGKLPKQSDKPSKPAREILDSLDEISKGIKSNDNSTIDKAKKLVKKMELFWGNSFPDSDVAKKSWEQVWKAKTASDLEEPIQSLVKSMVEVSADEYGRVHPWAKEKMNGFYGFGDESTNRLKKIASGFEKKPEQVTKTEEQVTKTEEQVTKTKKGVSPKAKEMFGKFEQTAKDAAEMMSSQLFDPKKASKFFRGARDLVDYLKEKAKEIDESGKLEELLEKAAAAIEDGDFEKANKAVFASNGIKNYMHNGLKQVFYSGDFRGIQNKDHAKFFGDTKEALEEFDRLGQI